MLTVCLTLNVGTLILFTMTSSYTALVMCRMFTGLFQVYFCIYLPVWADVFGNEKQKSNWVTYLLISSPLGVITGYIMCAVFQENIGWRYAFYIQSVLLIPVLFLIVSTPERYMDIQGLAR